MSDTTDSKQAVDRLNQAWEAYKATTDQHAAEIEKLGKASADTQDKLTRIGADVDKYGDIKERLEKVEVALKRPAPARDQKGNEMSPEQVGHKAAFGRFLRKGEESGLRDLEHKALSVGSDPDGGYLVPADLSGRIVARVFDTSPIRQIAALVTISTDALEGPRDTDEASAGWVAETGSRAETISPTLGTWRIPVHEMYANPRATQKLLDDAALDVDAWLSAKIADKFARLENTAFVAGTGVSQPRGFTAYTTAATPDASRAWGTLEHVVSGANGDFAATNPADKLFDLEAAFKPQYLAGAVWVTRRSVIVKIRKFKDGQGQYLWQPGLQAGKPATLIGYPVFLAEDMPSLATGSLSLSLGNFREAYQIVDRQGIRLLRDPYSAKPYVQFYSTRRVGGDVVQFEAIKFIKFSA